MPTSTLSPREQNVVAGVARGLPNKLIAHELGLSTGTVKVYVSRLLTKLGLGNRTELALWALKQSI